METNPSSSCATVQAAIGLREQPRDMSAELGKIIETTAVCRANIPGQVLITNSPGVDRWQITGAVNERLDGKRNPSPLGLSKATVVPISISYRGGQQVCRNPGAGGEETMREDGYSRSRHEGVVQGPGCPKGARNEAVSYVLVNRPDSSRRSKRPV